MYEPSLGRFHTLDPHAENYLSWTPYNYAANNPILFIDPTGMDWEKTESTDDNGNIHMEYTITVKVKNSAGLDDEELGELTDAIINQVQSTFQGENEDGTFSYTTNLIFDFEGEVEEGDFYFDFVDQVDDNGTPTNYVGKVDEIGDFSSNRIQVKVNRPSLEEMAKVSAHEIGHTGGLTHPAYPVYDVDENGVNIGNERENVMNQGYFGTKVTYDQLSYIRHVMNNGYNATPYNRTLKSNLTPNNIKEPTIR
ncbi:MAG: hypothetical protein JW801_10390 [Bacteroidales bacterium]|nr:hypothetical protein [Bacteroidales bacterium]